MDYIEALAKSRTDALLDTLKASACTMLHKAGFGAPAAAKPPEDDKEACPHCGKSVADHGAPGGAVEGTDAAAAAPKPAPPKPGAADATAATGAGASDAAAQDESAAGAGDPIEDLTDPEAAPDDAEGAEAEGDDPIEDLADDGQNHGVGDLNEDGIVQSLAQELAALEKDYYAAKGLHGDGSGKTLVALDRYHRVVRKLARAVQGGAAGAAAPEGTDHAEPDGDEGPDPRLPADDDGDEASAAPPAAAGAKQPAPEPDGPPTAAGDDADPEKKKNPFGKGAIGSGMIIGGQPRGPGRAPQQRETIQLAPDTAARDPFAHVRDHHAIRKSSMPGRDQSPVVLVKSDTERVREANATATAGILGNLARLGRNQGL